MSVRMGHSSIDENGNASGGQAGDQTGKEVCIRDWYSKPWDYMAIYPDAAVREKMAACCEDACNNDHIGYDQNQRNTLHPLAVAVDFDYSKITTDCECDCSSLMNSLAVAGGTGASYGSNGWTTSTMKEQLQKLGFVIITSSTYLTSSAYCVRGAIYVKSGSHTAMGLDNGSKYEQTLEKAGLSVGNTEYVGKGIGSAKANEEMCVRTGAGTSYTYIGMVSKGDSVEVLEITDNNWYKIVWPAASCGYAYTSNSNGSYYTYTENSTTATTAKTATDAAASRNDSYAGTYTVTADWLNVRNGAGTNKEVMTTIPKGTKVKNYGYYTRKNSTVWLYVQFTYNNILYTGFASKNYLTK